LRFGAPLSTETTQLHHALVQPFITSQHLGRDAVRTVDREMPCITTMNNEHQLVVPPYLIVQRCTDTKDGVTNPISLDEPMRSLVTVAQHVLITPPFIAELRNNSDVRSIDNPLSTITTTGSHHALVTPFVMAYYGNMPTYASAKEPLPTMTTVQRHALITPEDLLPECGFRMLEPNELKRGMSFPDSYIVLGSKRDQVRQIGNAVCANVAQWIGERVMTSLQ
jgi:DNA (cytosine-5)-methyltransferase 1